MKHNLVITIGRQFGSGGRDIGHRLSEILGIGFYDKKLITEAARMSGLSTDIFEQRDERTPGTLMHALSTGFGFNPSLTEGLFTIQSDSIREITARESCVMVGRCADYVLRDNPRCFNVFIHAPEKVRASNILAREKSVDNVRELMSRMDKSRAAYYNFYTDKKWGFSTSYHLTVDSSLLGPEATAQMIADFVSMADRA